MSHRPKKFLSAGLAGVLCSTALLGLSTAHADGKNNLHLPGMRARPHAPDNIFTRIFPELPPFAQPTDAAREQAKKLGEKGPTGSEAFSALNGREEASDPVALVIAERTRSLP